MRQRDGTPLWIDRARQEATSLRRIDLRAGAATYDEAWLQALIDVHPEILPVRQIEPGFGRLISLCRELPLTLDGCRSGVLDNLLVTPEGGLVLAEAKLWRNPDARRAVVGQVLEYAASVFQLSYEAFEAAVLRARGPGDPFKSVFEIVSQHAAGISEAEFVDAVTHNLKRGRAIIAVVGDGVREEIARVAQLLQSNAGHRFTFALVELAIYETPESGVQMVVPSTLAQTSIIERGVVQIDDGEARSGQVVMPSVAGGPRKPSSELVSDSFFEKLHRQVPGSSVLVRSFLKRARRLGIGLEWRAGLKLKYRSPGNAPLYLATIDRKGNVDTEAASARGRSIIGRHYNETLASVIGGKVREGGRSMSSLRTADGKKPRVTDLLPKHEDAWLGAIEQYILEALGPPGECQPQRRD